MTTASSTHAKPSTTAGAKAGPAAAEPAFLAIGRIVKPHGINGEVLVKVLTDFTERFDTMQTVFLGDDVAPQLYEVATIRWHREMVLIRFEAMTTRNQAEALRGLYLQIPTETAMPLAPGTYYHYQLTGLQVHTDQGENLGTLTDIIETGANDVYVIRDQKTEILLPAIQDVILDVDLEVGVMTVHLLDGLR